MGYRNNVNRFRKVIGVILSFVLLSAIPLGQTKRITLAQERPLAGESADAANRQLPASQELSTATAETSAAGVLLQWHTSFEQDTLGFNVYRVRDGQRSRLNHSIIPGSVFQVGPGKPLPGGRAYEWADRDGTADSLY